MRTPGPQDPGDLILAPGLKYYEIRCKTTKSGGVTSDVLAAWSIVRDEINRPIDIISGYRSIDHQKKMMESGVKTRLDSWHTHGMALDLDPVSLGKRGYNLYNLEALRLFYRAGFKGLIYGNGRFHCDVRPMVFIGTYDQDGTVRPVESIMELMGGV